MIQLLHSRLFCFGLILLCFLSNSLIAQENVGIGTSTPNPNALLDLEVPDPATNPMGLLMPRLTTVQRNALTLTNVDQGLAIFNTTTGIMEIWNGSAWVAAVGDDLGNHLATTDLDMNSFDIQNADSLYAQNAVIISNLDVNNDLSALGTIEGSNLIATNNIIGQGNAFFNAEVQIDDTLRAHVIKVENNANPPYVLPIQDGAASNVMQTDGSGNLSWVDPLAITGDNLGNHIATQNLDLASYELVGNGGTIGLNIDNAGNIGINASAAANDRVWIEGGAGNTSGLYATSNLSSGVASYGVYGDNVAAHTSGQRVGVFGRSNQALAGDNLGVYGRAIKSTGNNFGVLAEAEGPGGTLVGIESKALGANDNTSYAGRFYNTTSGSPNNTYGLEISNSGSATSIQYGTFSQVGGTSTATKYGVYGQAGGSGTKYGVFGQASGTSDNKYGVYGRATGSGGTSHYGVYGNATGGTNNYAIYGIGSGAGNFAGYFNGDVLVTSGEFRYVDGNEAAGKVLQSNASGTASWEFPSISYFEGNRYALGVNATVPVHEWTVKAADANIDLALTPKGTGAIIGQVPTGTAIGGNKRGDNAVDWQTFRDTDSAQQVASGNYSVIAGGRSNTASGRNSTISGGRNNIADG